MPKEQTKKKKAKQMHTYYTVKGDSLERKNKFCSKCGSGYFLARHSDRLRCGKCGYMEFAGKA